MSNYAKVFCAAVFFVLATVTSSTRSDDESVIRQISFLYECIENRASLLKRLITNANSLPSNDDYFSLINELKQNMTEDADGVRLTVDSMINNPKNTHAFDKTECKRFLVDYEHEIEDVEARLNNKTSDALNQTTEALQHALNETNRALHLTMKPLKIAASTCKGSSCNSLLRAADATLRRVFGMTSKLVCADQRQFHYMRMIVQMENGIIIEKGVDVVRKTENCVYGKNSTYHGSSHIKIDS